MSRMTEIMNKIVEFKTLQFKIRMHPGKEKEKDYVKTLRNIKKEIAKLQIEAHKILRESQKSAIE